MGTVCSTHECAENFIQIWSAYFKGRFHVVDMEVRTYTLNIKSCKLLAFQKQIMKMLTGMNCTIFRVEYPAIYITIINIPFA
jgi:hypothetical protein